MVPSAKLTHLYNRCSLIWSWYNYSKMLMNINLKSRQKLFSLTRRRLHGKERPEEKEEVQISHGEADRSTGTSILIQSNKYFTTWQMSLYQRNRCFNLYVSYTTSVSWSMTNLTQDSVVNTRTKTRSESNLTRTYKIKEDIFWMNTCLKVGFAFSASLIQKFLNVTGWRGSTKEI